MPDVILSKREKQDGTIDSILSKTNTQSVSFDSILRGKIQTKDLSIDAILRSKTQIKEIPIDVLLKEAKTYDFLADAIINKIQEQSFSADSILEGAGKRYYHYSTDTIIGNIFNVNTDQILTLSINQSASISGFKTEYIKDRILTFTTRSFTQDELIYMFDNNFMIQLDLSDVGLEQISLAPIELKVLSEIYNVFSISGVIKE
jgi:hypothetical protein